MKTIFNNDQKAFVSQLITLFIFLLFVNCKKAKEDNCIVNMYIELINENPGPDVMSFKFNSNYKELDANLENIELLELFFNDKDIFRSSAMFELEKINKNEYKLKMATPHFAQHGYHTEKQIYDFYQKSVDLKIVLSTEKDNFTFVKCTK